MPQLTKFDDFCRDLDENNISLTNQDRKPSDLIPTQKNFNQEKVDKIKEKAGWSRGIPSVMMGHPIIISRDDYVVDGHHRWLAAHQLNVHVSCRTVGMDAEDLLEFLKGKDYIEKKTINEEVTFE